MRKLSKREQHSVCISELKLFIHYVLGFPVTEGEAYRTKEQQALYIKQGKSKVKISQHQKRLADDIFIWDNKNPNKPAPIWVWMSAGKYWLAKHPDNRWGGNFGVTKSERFLLLGWDRWHYERRG